MNPRSQSAKPVRGPIVRGVVAAAALALSLSAFASPAEAGHRYRHGYSGGDLLAAGVLGAVVGAIVAPPVYAAPVYAAPPVVYVEPPVVYGGPLYYPEPVYGGPAYYPEPVYGGDPVYGHGGDKYLGEGWGGPAYGKPPVHKKHKPKVVTYEETVGSIASGGYADPWSPEWFNWCRSKYRSFDNKTGTYKGHDGKRHFCEMN